MSHPELAPAALMPAIHATPQRPLLGLTILLVEDSRLASEALRLLCLRSGARLRRADSLAAAERHLRTYRPSAAVIDLGLPDGSGLDLIRLLDRAQPRIDAILATSGDDSLEDAARAAGADGFLAKPVPSLGAFQALLLSRLPADRGPCGPRAVPDDAAPPDPAALRDDLSHAAELLALGGPAERAYVAQFVAGVGASAGDATLRRAAEALGLARSDGRDGAEEARALARTLRERLAPLPIL